ncbi:helix-turn-helix domain-containing protein [Clostridium beijerinckii]|uniref:helix-turn-helix domain-containing protein n=1 Tax=Clostridium beijerinckii TaxID=1520 RepID=UPI0013613CC1|nr:helix-turn-helix transcriptional regulator [Clostridium beijerinckii]MZK53327.1 helix-turn-helix domain-containing protein [Clostridium beijerinckii]MZK61432.1 helix-turn-helix domain-containing protein [Clostridium beijerinckii]MZK71674.1 helix-turn-helix domain-containing protein [Clostridium beijerinckii]MZK77067.1 helix-turn-helix domain-containing protein [Clostridium beijerinckii]MZK86722.1 helix-turn-helix domain-containing protein [Clostridium beijerinckii]
MDNKILAERLKNIRKEHRLTQTQLAEKLEVAKSVIAGAETKRGISKTLASKLAEFFETDVDYWINENADKEFVKEMKFLEMTRVSLKRLLDEKIITLDNLDDITNDKDICNQLIQSLKLDAKIALKKKEQN